MAGRCLALLWECLRNMSLPGTQQCIAQFRNRSEIRHSCDCQLTLYPRSCTDAIIGKLALSIFSTTQYAQWGAHRTSNLTIAIFCDLTDLATPPLACQLTKEYDWSNATKHTLHVQYHHYTNFNPRRLVNFSIFLSRQLNVTEAFTWTFLSVLKQRSTSYWRQHSSVGFSQNS